MNRVTTGIGWQEFIRADGDLAKTVVSLSESFDGSVFVGRLLVVDLRSAGRLWRPGTGWFFTRCEVWCGEVWCGEAFERSVPADSFLFDLLNRSTDRKINRSCDQCNQSAGGRKRWQLKRRKANAEVEKFVQ